MYVAIFACKCVWSYTHYVTYSVLFVYLLLDIIACDVHNFFQLVLDDVSQQLQLTKTQLEECKSKLRNVEHQLNLSKQENEKLSDDLITLREQGIRTEEDLKSARQVGDLLMQLYYVCVCV